MMEQPKMQNQQVNSSVCLPERVAKTETVILVRSEQGESVDALEDRNDPRVKDNAVEMSKLPEEEKLEAKVSEPPKHNCLVIDINKHNHNHSNSINCGTLEDGEPVCRICHLSSDRPSDATSELIQLGCDCKDELGISHRHCAEAWFKLKGNRCCEICGEAAKNITGVWDNRFMEEWNERRVDGPSGESSERRWGFWRGQPFCNFLMACLVMAFVLPWFFRVNMF